MKEAEREVKHKNRTQINYSRLYLWMFKVQLYNRSQVTVIQFSISRRGNLHSEKNQYENFVC